MPRWKRIRNLQSCNEINWLLVDLLSNENIFRKIYMSSYGIINIRKWIKWLKLLEFQFG